MDNFKTNGRIKTKFGSAAQNWSAIVPVKFGRVHSRNVENIRKHFVFSLIMDHSVDISTDSSYRLYVIGSDLQTRIGAYQTCLLQSVPDSILSCRRLNDFTLRDR